MPSVSQKKAVFDKNIRATCNQVEAEMEQLQSKEAREIEVYKRELMAWFKQQKEEQDKSRVVEEHTAKERFKVLL